MTLSKLAKRILRDILAEHPNIKISAAEQDVVLTTIESTLENNYDPTGEEE